DGTLADAAEPFGAVHADVSVRAYQHAEVAVKRLDAADGVGTIVVEIVPVAVLLDHGRGEKPHQVLTDRDGSRPGPASAMGRGERLVQVEVDDVKAHVAGPATAQNRIRVGAV